MEGTAFALPIRVLLVSALLRRRDTALAVSA
jgi:uncharacterized protein (TIGR03382 family)